MSEWVPAWRNGQNIWQLLQVTCRTLNSRLLLGAFSRGDAPPGGKTTASKSPIRVPAGVTFAMGFPREQNASRSVCKIGETFHDGTSCSQEEEGEGDNSLKSSTMLLEGSCVGETAIRAKGAPASVFFTSRSGPGKSLDTEGRRGYNCN